MATGLRVRGHEVEEAEDGLAGMNILKNRMGQAGSMELVITDMNMPGMDGLGLVKSIRALPLDIPVCVVSGTMTVTDGLLIKSAGGGPVLEKPFTVDALCNVLHIA
ncbi:MAG: two-component system, OmpR family, response regulator PrrA [Candidatus Parcubacteria bacterium]|nr:two-component system, OmpR family, response regulator PrrA [Candidatus Parcubacteria bacterium]